MRIEEEFESDKSEKHNFLFSFPLLIKIFVAKVINIKKNVVDILSVYKGVFSYVRNVFSSSIVSIINKIKLFFFRISILF